MKISAAMVLAAGLGTRMRPLTDDRPKALVEVAGRALIDHMLDRLVAAGVTRAIVNVHAFADRLEAHLMRRRDVEIVISDERTRLMETGGGVRQALPLLGQAPIFVANIDSIWLNDEGALARLGAGFDSARMGARLLLAPMAHVLGFDGAGDFHMGGEGALARRGAAPAAEWAYSGVQVIDPRVVDGEPLEPFSFTRVWRALEEEGRLFGVGLQGLWMHVGDPGARAAAEVCCVQAAPA